MHYAASMPDKKMTRRLFFVGALLTALLAVPLATPHAAQAQENGDMMQNLTNLQDDDVRSRRVSSYDESGGNQDWLGPVPDGETRTLADIDGAGVVKHIWITIAPPPGQLSRNDIILRMYWDGEEEPSVEAPIGPFFGQGWEENYTYSSMPLAVGPRGGRALVSYFQMPFAENARIEIENQTGRKINKFYYYIDYAAMDELPEGKARFHAQYRQNVVGAPPHGENEWRSLPDRPYPDNTTGERNYLIADIEGKGHFVGVNYYVHSPTTIWYGEGDDMFFIDGEEWPASLHGTGTEDYFNTSWVPKTIYEHPFYGYARVNEGSGWLGRTHSYRFHVTDPVYFNESLRFSIEHGHANQLTLDLRSVAYWYQEEPHKPFPPLPSAEEREPKPQIRAGDIHRWRDAWRRSMGNDSTLWGNER